MKQRGKFLEMEFELFFERDAPSLIDMDLAMRFDGG
jgi:hypothetical protein